MALETREQVYARLKDDYQDQPTRIGLDGVVGPLIVGS
ncbi:hypothetical protein HNR22_001338 [Micromonospora jinlongensis]|uniref:Uncharacterized protein n=1 Tax=Micromonospora jinlongensis TaxID=1287877 RepID=A0A7Y9WXZ8_9ACTN|nr:hypothetical protein [Micromonospora jinlongensis]